MICKIADVGVSVPNLGNLYERCRQYEANMPEDITIDADKMKPNRWKTLSAEDNYYLDSGFRFYCQLLRFDGMMLHASAVIVDGYAYLFSGPCGIGKSTHTAKYLSGFPDSVIINDDKPALRLIDGVWMAYGTPWCGKDGINQNISAPLAGICFLRRGDRNIRRLSVLEAVPRLLSQTNGRAKPEQAKQLISLVDKLVTNIPIFEFFNHAEQGDEQITYQAMHDAMGERNIK